MNLTYRVSGGQTFEALSFLKGAAALVLAFALVALLSDRNIPSAIDDLNYLEYASYGAELLFSRYQDTSLLGFLLAEPLWLAINAVLGASFDEELVVRIIIGASTGIMAASMLRLTKWNTLACIGFLLFPTVLSNYIIHLRQGAAMSILLLFLAFWPRWLLVGAGLAALTHSSLWVIFGLLMLDRNPLARRYMQKAAPIATSVVWIVFIVSMPLVLQEVLGGLEDRRAHEYDFRFESTASGLGFVLWLVILLLFLAKRPAKLTDEWRYAVALISMYLGWYFFLEIGTRVLSSGLVFVWLAGSRLEGKGRWVFWSLWVVGAVVAWTLQWERVATFWGVGE